MKTKLEELFAKVRPSRREDEHRIQCACVRWFRLKYSSLYHLLFAVPNGGVRDKVTGAKMKAEGVLAGVADLILLVPNARYHGLCIEMKTKTGRQSDSQKIWETHVVGQGYRYAVCRSLDDFMTTIQDYLR